MKRSICMTIMAAALLCSGGCQESLPEHFQDIEGVYFNNLLPNRSHTDSIGVTFIYEDKDVIDVPVRVQLLGRLSSTDRMVSIRTESVNAEEGKDYTLPDKVFLPADSTVFDYMIRLKRTPELKTGTKKVTVLIEENDKFIIPFETLSQSGGETTRADRFIIEFSDQFTAPPAGWNTLFVGEFSQQKFELMTRVMDIPRSYFNEKGKITAAKWIYIQEQMTLYVKGEIKKKEAGQEFDAQAFDKNGNPIIFYIEEK